MLAILIVNIVMSLILLGILTTILIIYFKQSKDHKKEKAEYELKINYYIKELRERVNEEID